MLYYTVMSPNAVLATCWSQTCLILSLVSQQCWNLPWPGADGNHCPWDVLWAPGQHSLRTSHDPLVALLSLSSKPIKYSQYLQPSHCYPWYHCYYNSLSSLQRGKWYLLQISWGSFQWETVQKKSVTQKGKKQGVILWHSYKSHFLCESWL